MVNPPLPRWALLACGLLAVINLLGGMGGGLGRLGVPGPRGAALAYHGMLMVCGFFGTVISLERAAALKRRWALCVPLLAGAGGVAVLAGAPLEAGLALWCAAAAGLVGLYLWAGFTRAWSWPLSLEMLGAACWCLGSAIWWQGSAAHRALPAWMAFLALTIAAERRELMGFVKLSAVARGWFAFAALLLPAASVLSLVDVDGLLPQWSWVDTPMLLFWIGCALLALWLLAHDFAPRQWRAPEWRGFTAQSLTLGYVWLGVAALLGIGGRWAFAVSNGPAWHALLLGFVFSMVFGHAAVILPALARLTPVYTPWVRLPMWLLSASLALRIAGAGLRSSGLLAAAGIGHALAIVLFAGLLAAGLRRGAAQPGRPSARGRPNQRP
jgi:hypothetical protein